jgi:hypothetical protein
MNTFRFEVTGSEENLSELAEFLRAQNVSCEHGGSVANEGGKFLAALFILSAFNVFPKCITAFMKEKKKRLKAFVEDKGFIELENYTAKDLEKILPTITTIHIEEDEE